jgi:DNA ligase-1
MSSPAKKRKRNDGAASNIPSRGLDFFFKKQGNGEVAAAEPPQINETVGLSDEDLARKLQAQWDQEYQAGQDVLEQPKAESPPLVVETLKPEPVKNTLSLQSAGSIEDSITATIPLDESPLVFDCTKFATELKHIWAADHGNATYALLTRCFILVNATTSRIKIVDTLVNTLRLLIEADPESLLPAVWLATNSIAPPYQDMELGLGGSAISKALKTVCGLDSSGLRTLYSKYGDAGDVAYEAKKRQSFTLKKPKPLRIRAVYQSLVRIANSKGQGSVQIKQQIVERLLLDARGAEESRYITRTLVQHLRIGAVKTTMLIALSRAFLLSKPTNAEYPTRSVKDLTKLKKEDLIEVYKNAEELVKASYARHPNYADLVPVLLSVGISEELLIRCGLTLHIPLRPMLGSITRDLGDMLNRLQGRLFTCEYKYDGQRAQVHCDAKGKVSIFSRHLELMTDKYPDLVQLVPTIRGEGVQSFILEGEVVAIDHLNGELKTFQTLSNRAKKDVAVGSITVGVCLFAFDLMYLNGEELLDRSFGERRSLLKSLFIQIPNKFTWVKSIDATSAESDTVLDFFKGAVEAKCEGIMVKVLDSPPAEPEPIKAAKSPKRKPATDGVDDKPSRRKALLSTYEPDKRLESWLKVKKDYNASADTLDLIPIGGWHGQGRKAKWWSPILLAVRNPDSGQLVAVTKCISGFTDVFYGANRAKYDPEEGKNIISRPSYVDYYGPEPEVWFEPQEVWEICFADITLSPTYTAAVGLVSEERGLSLRFPRFLKVREDKSIEEASTEDFLADLWHKQAAKAPEPVGNDEDQDE